MLELKKTQVELSRVRSAREELELKIMENEEQIKRLKEHIEIQLKREAELEEKLNSLRG